MPPEPHHRPPPDRTAAPDDGRPDLAAERVGGRPAVVRLLERLKRGRRLAPAGEPEGRAEVLARLAAGRVVEVAANTYFAFARAAPPLLRLPCHFLTACQGCRVLLLWHEPADGRCYAKELRPAEARVAGGFFALPGLARPRPALALADFRPGERFLTAGREPGQVARCQPDPQDGTVAVILDPDGPRTRREALPRDTPVSAASPEEEARALRRLGRPPR